MEVRKGDIQKVMEENSAEVRAVHFFMEKYREVEDAHSQGKPITSAPLFRFNPEKEKEVILFSSDKDANTFTRDIASHLNDTLPHNLCEISGADIDKFEEDAIANQEGETIAYNYKYPTRLPGILLTSTIWLHNGAETWAFEAGEAPNARLLETSELLSERTSH